MPAVVSRTDGSCWAGTSDPDFWRRWSRASKKDRKVSRISSDFMVARRVRDRCGAPGPPGRLEPPVRLLVLASIIAIPSNVGYLAVFVLIAIETMGVPVPGETALIAGSLSAHHGDLEILPLVAIAAAAAILG